MITFGVVWALDEFCEKIAEKGFHKAFVISFPSDHEREETELSAFAQSAEGSAADYRVKQAGNAMKKAGLEHCRAAGGFGAVLDREQVEACAKEYQESGADCLVTLDSVYSLDLAKAVSMTLKHPLGEGWEQLPETLTKETGAVPIFVMSYWNRRV